MPSTIFFIKFHLQRLLDDLVNSFYLAIGLWMGRRSEENMNLEIGEKLLELGIVKLPTVLCDDDMRYAEMTYKTLLNEISNATRRYSSQSFGFGPFGKIIDNRNGVFDLAFSLRHRTNEVKSPLDKGP